MRRVILFKISEQTAVAVIVTARFETFPEPGMSDYSDERRSRAGRDREAGVPLRELRLPRRRSGPAARMSALSRSLAEAGAVGRGVSRRPDPLGAAARPRLTHLEVWPRS